MPRTHAALLLTLTASAVGQQPVGFTFHTQSSVASRGTLNTIAGEVMQRFDHDDLRGWGALVPGTHTIRGASFVVQDMDASTPSNFDLKFYGEDPARPNFPDVTTTLASVTGIAGPTGAGTIAVQYTITLLTPLTVPATGDLFMALFLPAAPAWPADGLTPQCTLGAPAGSFTVYDRPGSAAIPQNGYCVVLATATGTLVSPTTRSELYELLTDAPGGIVTAITNQTSFAVSNTAPGTGSFFSAFHPDASSPPRNAGRADDIGYAYLDPALPDGSLVVFVAEFGGFAAETPLSTLLPGSIGSTHLGTATATVLGLRLLNSGEAAFVTTIPAAARPLLGGLSLLQQGIGVDALNGTMRGGPTGRQQF